MKNHEIIKKAQQMAGEYVTGYKYDVNPDTLNHILEMIWIRSKNLGYSFVDFRCEVSDVIGKRKYAEYTPEICGFCGKKQAEGHFFWYHGTRYCA